MLCANDVAIVSGGSWSSLGNVECHQRHRVVTPEQVASCAAPGPGDEAFQPEALERKRVNLTDGSAVSLKAPALTFHP